MILPKRRTKSFRYITFVMASLTFFVPFTTFGTHTEGHTFWETDFVQSCGLVICCVSMGVGCLYLTTGEMFNLRGQPYAHAPVYTMLGKPPEYIDAYTTAYEASVYQRKGSSIKSLLLTVVAPVASVLTFTAAANLLR